MAIILEGPDNSGKTTLARNLAKILHMPVYHPGGPAGSDEAALKFCSLQYAMMSNMRFNLIMDRVTCISRQIYENRMNDRDLMEYLNIVVKDSHVIVYCRPSNEHLMDFSSHEAKDYDTEEHLKYITENQHSIIQRYDSIMKNIPCIHYDWSEGLDIKYVASELLKCMASAIYLYNFTNFTGK